MNDWITAISSLGFPIVICLIMIVFVKYLFDTYKDQIAQMSKEHREETSSMTDAINELKMTIQTLIDKMGE